jgi:quercetin dioxygenase-like cupin family protein
MPGRVRTEVHLGSDDTEGAFCLLVDRPPAGWSLPAHLHRGVAETIHVLEGEFAMTVGGRESRLSAGQTMHIAADVVHSSANAGSSTGRRILIFSPGGMERFFLEAGAPDEEADVEMGAVLAAARRHGWDFVGAD